MVYIDLGAGSCSRFICNRDVEIGRFPYPTANIIAAQLGMNSFQNPEVLSPNRTDFLNLGCLLLGDLQNTFQDGAQTIPKAPAPQS